MLGKIFGAAAGQSFADRFNLSGGQGALLGAGTVSILRRLSPLGILAAAAGGYAAKRYYDKKNGAPKKAPKPTKRAD